MRWRSAPGLEDPYKFYAVQMGNDPHDVGIKPLGTRKMVSDGTGRWVGSVGDVKIWSKLGITRISSLTIVFGSWKLRHRHFPNKDESGLGWVYQQNLNTPMRLVGGLGSLIISPHLKRPKKQAMDSCGESWSSCGCDDQALLAHHRRVIEWPSFFGWLKLPLDFQRPSWIILDHFFPCNQDGLSRVLNNARHGIRQSSRFGIGDVTFLCLAYGLLESWDMICWGHRHLEEENHLIINVFVWKYGKFID